jgi:Na+/alanine symporter
MGRPEPEKRPKNPIMTILEWLSGLAWPIVLIVLIVLIGLLAPTDTSVAQAVRDYASTVIQDETGKDGTRR